jgi:alcohol dehydrogenase
MIDFHTNDTIPVLIPGSAVRLLFGRGTLARLGELIRAENASRVLLVTDPGIRKAGHIETAMRSLYQADLATILFDKVIENPTADTVLACWRSAHKFKPDLVVGLGGGSSMDTAKGFNFIHTNGGHIQDYVGTGKAARPMLPMIAIPTTAGTGSEAQSYALISDPETHVKMACGDKKALPRIAILDPDLTATCPPKVAAATGIDAISHAVETAGSTARTDVSRGFSKQAWQLLDSSFPASLVAGDASARSRMLLGAHLAGCAIENSMLGAAHATANPLAAKFDVVHGVAVGLMLPHVIRFNARGGSNPYADLGLEADALAARIEAHLAAAGLPGRLSDAGVAESAIESLAELAAKQWTAGFNPRPVGASELAEIYRMAL